MVMVVTLHLLNGQIVVEVVDVKAVIQMEFVLIFLFLMVYSSVILFS